jgi:predicted PurR-regulated permease PerM
MPPETPLADLQVQNNLHRDERSPQTFTQKILIALGIFAVLTLTGIVLWQGIEVFLLIFAGLLLAIFLRSLSDFLSKHTPLSENLALTTVLLAIVALAGLGLWFLSDSIQSQFFELSESLPAAFNKLREVIAQYPLGQRIVEKIPAPQSIILGSQRTNIFGRITGLFSTVFDAVTNILVILITGIYFAYNPRLYSEGAVKLVPKKWEKRTREILSTIVFTLRRFLLGIAAAMTINGAITAVGLWVLGIPFALPLGILTGLLNFVPNIGPIAASVPAVLIAFSQSPTQALYVAAVCRSAEH